MNAPESVRVNTGNHYAETPELELPLARYISPAEFELERDPFGMLPVHRDVWNGLVFVNISAQPRETLREWLDDLADGYGDYFDQQHKLSSHSFELDANWNLGINAFTEGYHTLYIHQNTAGDYQGGKSNPQRHRPFMQFTKRHTRYSAPANPEHRLAPSEELAYRYGRRMLPAACFQNDTLPAAVNPSRVEHCRVRNAMMAEA